MPNFFTDSADLRAKFDQLDLRTVVEILEHGYGEPSDEAPSSYEDAMDGYRLALELTGDIAGNYIAPRSTGIDAEGAHFSDGVVTYARGTDESRSRLAQAGLMGVIIPRKYGGLQFPATIYMMMIEMVSQADASMMTLFGYQDVGEAIALWGTHEQAQEFLPKYAAGERIGAMVLTEPGAGSDLQATRLQAHCDDAGQWYLKGTKHFISNGNGDLLLVLAKSEPGTDGIFGLSLFACHGDAVNVNRVEEKMGLHGSPTCELYFDDAPAQLIGRQRFGLLQVVHILNHARFSVAAQALGIAQAAYDEALAYAQERVQFGRKIYSMPPVANMLIDMRVTLEANRALLYAGSQWLDLHNKLEEGIKHRKAAGEDRSEYALQLKRAAPILELLSPMVKYTVSEAANRVCYDAQQIHGGMGFIREIPVERYARDVRITSIYEGTSQVQIGGATKGVKADVLAPLFEEFAQRCKRPELAPARASLEQTRHLFDESVSMLADRNEAFTEVASKDLVDIYSGLYAGWLLMDEAQRDDRKVIIATRFAHRTLALAHAGVAHIRSCLYDDIGVCHVVNDTDAPQMPVDDNT